MRNVLRSEFDVAHRNPEPAPEAQVVQEDGVKPNQYPDRVPEGPDAEFSIFYRAESHSMQFLVVLVTAWMPEGPLLYGTAFSPDPAEGEVLMYGWLKWDGCTDLTIGAGQDYQLHFCSLREAGVIARAIEALYRLGAEKMSGWRDL